MEITGAILKTRDADKYLLDLIIDEAGQKGTGPWAVSAAMDLGVPVPTITAAVEARNISSQRAMRITMQQPQRHIHDLNVEAVRGALVAGTISAYAQGFSVLAAAQKNYWPNLNLAMVAQTWRGGCIIRSTLLDDIQAAFTASPDLPSILLAPAFATLLSAHKEELRSTAIKAQTAQISAPAFAATLSYLDAFTAPQLWTNLVQAQRDYFGAHGFQRTDRAGVQHGSWHKE